jgi:hypothetical protein
MKSSFALLCLVFLVVRAAQAIEGELTIGEILQDSHGNLEIQVFWDGDVNKYYNETYNGEWCLVGYLETSWILRIGKTSKIIGNYELRANRNETLVFDGIPFEDLPENCTCELEMYYITYDDIPRLFHERYVLNYHNTYIQSFTNQAASSANSDVLYILPFAIIAILCLMLWHYK